MKNYEEIANNVFSRRDEYISKKKRKKRIIIATLTPILCCCFVLTIGFGLWKNGVFGRNIPISDSSQTNIGDVNSKLPEESNQNSATVNSSSKENYSSKENNLSKSSSNKSNSSQDGFATDKGSSSKPTNDTSSKKSNKTSSKPSNVISSSSSKDVYSNSSDDVTYEPSYDISSDSPSSAPSVEESGFLIDSLDKMNFYSAKKAINDNSILPTGMNFKNSFMSKTIPLNYNYAQYPMDRYKVFTLTMVTYFTIELNDEKGFLAQKLGGTGLIEVVVTRNDIEEMGAMITFKRGNRYYSCLKNGESRDPETNKGCIDFSSHKYIDGFNLVKNKNQENYKFFVHYDGAKVVGFECAPFQSVPTKYNTDDITFIEDFCVVIFTKQSFTIDQLEVYFKNENEEDLL